jgi:hypothetical protein
MMMDNLPRSSFFQIDVVTNLISDLLPSNPETCILDANLKPYPQLWMT